MTNDHPGVVHTAATSKQEKAPRALTTPPNDREATRRSLGPIATLVALLLGFLIIESFVPMGSAVQIGADEGFELAKATLCVKGHHLYTEVWNDQPPLHTFLVTGILKHASLSVLGPRLLTVGFSVLLLTAVFVIVSRVSGVLVASLTTGMIIASPGFVELSSSCMLEIPALATVLASIAVLSCGQELALSPALSPKEREIGTTPSSKGHVLVVVAGVVFGLGLQMKLVPVVYLPLAALVILLRGWNGRDSIWRLIPRMAVFGASLVMAYVVSDLLIERGAYLTHFGQSWKSHFGAVKPSSEYGSPSQHPFDWGVLWKNWDVTVPAMVGVGVLLARLRKKPEDSGRAEADRKNFTGGREGNGGVRETAAMLQGLPLIWLALTFVVFGIHRPWWAYYYLHTAIPLCWCAGIGIELLYKNVKRWMGLEGSGRHAVEGARGLRASTPAFRRVLVTGSICLFGVCSIVWMSARVYLQVTNLRAGPKIDSSPIIGQMQRFGPFTDWLYADKPVYSFHSGIPVVPSLGVMPVKRLWSGEMDNAGIHRQLEEYKPGLMVLINDGRDVPFKDLLDAEYQMVYMDSDNRLYALKEIVREARSNDE